MSEAQDRASIANEVFGSAETSPDVTADTTIVDDGAPLSLDATLVESDPWAGLPVALRDEVQGMRAKLQDFEKVDFRLKQAESRLGSVQNELHAAKEAAKTVANAPSKEQIAEASASQADWDSLKEAFPEWTNATDGRIAANRAEMLGQMRQEIQSAADEKIEKLTAETNASIVEMKHEDFKEVVNTPDFIQWHASVGKKDSFSPREVVAVIDEYKAYLSTRKTAKEIADGRKDRLALSQTTTNGRKLPAAKAEGDMSESEIRAATAKQVWGT